MAKITTFEDLNPVLKESVERVREAFERSKGPKGGRGNDFTLGYNAGMAVVLRAIERGDDTELRNVYHEVRGFKVDSEGKKIK